MKSIKFLFPIVFITGLISSVQAENIHYSEFTNCNIPNSMAVADQVTEQFDTHPFVLFGSTHGGIKRHEFLLCLLSRPNFQQNVTDIVVEFASGAHQELLDRYLILLEDIPLDSLRPIQLDVSYPQLYATLPQVPEFLIAVRKINENFSLENRIRVLGGNSPVKWSAIKSRKDYAHYPYKTNWAAHLITDHLATKPGKKVLVVYGDGHIKHGNGTLTTKINEKVPVDSLFVIGTIRYLREEEKETIEKLGDPMEAFYLGHSKFPDLDWIPDDLKPIIHPSPFTWGVLRKKIDAMIYLGPSSDKNLKDTISFSESEIQILAKRDSLKLSREVSKIRYSGKEDKWFKKHPYDIPEDPRIKPVEEPN